MWFWVPREISGPFFTDVFLNHFHLVSLTEESQAYTKRRYAKVRPHCVTRAAEECTQFLQGRAGQSGGKNTSKSPAQNKLLPLVILGKLLLSDGFQPSQKFHKEPSTSIQLRIWALACSCSMTILRLSLQVGQATTWSITHTEGSCRDQPSTSSTRANMPFGQRCQQQRHWDVYVSFLSTRGGMHCYLFYIMSLCAKNFSLLLIKFLTLTIDT